jgi:predicted XRE-type DNA-binding protein
MMAKKFRALVRETLTEEQQAAARAESQAMRLEMNLRQIREKLSALSQEDVAQLLNVTQPYISKLERQQDMLVSKLYEYVGTLGGQIEIHAKFPDRDVVVSQFDDLVEVFEVKVGQGTPPHHIQRSNEYAVTKARKSKRQTGAAKILRIRDARAGTTKAIVIEGPGLLKTVVTQRRATKAAKVSKAARR